MPRWSWIGRAMLAALLVLGAFAARAAEPPPLADFFRPPSVAGLVASPSGNYVAGTMAGGDRGRHRLVILDLVDISRSKVLIGFDDRDVIDVRWVNEDRLVFGLGDLERSVGERPGYELMSIDREGTVPPRKLLQFRYAKSDAPTNNRVLWANENRLYSVLRDGTDDVIIASYRRDGTHELVNVNLLRLDTATGRSRGITMGAPEYAMNWAVDQKGNPRATVTFREGKSKLYWKTSPEADWALAREFNSFDSQGAALDPLLVSSDGFLYAEGHIDPKDNTTGLLRFDMNKPGAPAQTILAIDGYDFSGNLVLGADGLPLGVRYLNDARATHWFDAGMKKLQATIDAAMPGLINVVSCGQCAAGGNVLVQSYSDRQPVMFSMFDRQADKLSPLARSRPWIDPRAMARADQERFEARDGLSIPVHVTRPPGATGAAPMVVLVHGGPNVRGGEWGWERHAQFLASRGYVVLEPEYRGSTGFGSSLFKAGWKQWGLGMQDDVADATAWAIKKGYADPKRVCISGASYGGYATLMGLIRYPELYRCGFEWVGVTDIDLMYSINWSDFGDAWKGYGMPVLVGDRVKDAKQFAETSPLKRATELKQPLLMAYGGSDRRVPIEHGLRMRDALAKSNPNVEWIEYPGEGHGWQVLKTNVDFWGRVERFLDKNLKSPPP